MTHPEDSCCTPGDSILSDGLNAAGLDLAVAGFAALWHGRALTPEKLIPHHGAAAAEVVAMLLARGRAEVDDHGNLVGIHGLTLRTTRHSIVQDGTVHSTWCAFDAVGIPAALGIDADAHTDCGTCQQPLHIAIRAGLPQTTDGLVLWLPAAKGDHLMSEFCASADLFCSTEHLECRLDTSTVSGHITDLDTAVELGRDTWADITPAALDATGDAPS